MLCCMSRKWRCNSWSDIKGLWICLRRFDCNCSWKIRREWKWFLGWRDAPKRVSADARLFVLSGPYDGAILHVWETSATIFRLHFLLFTAFCTIFKDCDTLPMIKLMSQAWPPPKGTLSDRSQRSSFSTTCNDRTYASRPYVSRKSRNRTQSHPRRSSKSC